MQEQVLQRAFAMINESKLINVILNLIRIPAETGQEAARASYIKELMVGLGLEVITQIVEPGRGPNVVGIMRGKGDGKKLMLHAHTDGWPSTREQENAGIANGKIKDGKVYGPGTGDQIACVTAFFGVMDILKRAGINLKGDLIWAQVIDEEIYMTGTQVLADVDCFGADMVLIGEPTDFNVGTAHTGLVEMELETKGYAGHPSHIGLGFKYGNAVLSMNKIINALTDMQKVEPIFNVNHPKLGKGATFYIGPIVGGFKSVGDPLRPVGPGRGRLGIAYMCPEWCKLRIGVRTLPGQDQTSEIVSVIKKNLEKIQKDDTSIVVDFRVYLDRNFPIEIADDSPAVNVLKRSIRKVIDKEPKLIGNVYCTDFPPIFKLKRGIPGAWTGPGLARYLRPDEHVTVQELVDTVKVFTAAAIDVCGVFE